MNTVNSEHGEITMSIPNEYRYTEGQSRLLSAFTLDGALISEFSIVTEGAELADAADALAALIKEKCGISLTDGGKHRILLSCDGTSGSTVTATMKNGDLILRPKRAKGDNEYKTFSIRIREELVEQLEDISARTGYSRNELIGRLLEYAVEHCTIAES